MDNLVFKPDLKFQFIDLVLLNLVAVIVFIYKDVSIIMSCIILLILNASIITFKKRSLIKKIIINRTEQKIIIYSKELFKNEKIIVSRNTNQNIIRSEMVTKAAARGGKLHFLNIMCNDRVICEIEAGLNGWSLKLLEKLRDSVKPNFWLLIG